MVVFLLIFNINIPFVSLKKLALILDLFVWIDNDIVNDLKKENFKWI